MVPELAIPEEEPVEVHIHKLATGVRDARTEMGKVQLELNLHITTLLLKVQPSIPPEVKEQWVTVVIEAIAAIDSAVADCTQIFEQSFKALTSLQEDPNVQQLETKACELEQHYDEVKRTAQTIALT